MANIDKLNMEYGKVLWTGKKCIMGLPISFTRYILTESKMITRTGFFAIKEDEIELYRVYDKSISLSFGQRIVGVGTIKLLSKDVDTPAKELISVKKPRDVKRIIDDAVQAQRDKYYVRGRDMMGTNMGMMHDHDNDGIADGMED